MNMRGQPFVKWVGGKRAVMSQIETLYPKSLHSGKEFTYVEPFVGGGGSLFYVINKFSNIQRVIICDKNKALINTYEVCKWKPKELIEALRNLQESYYKLHLLSDKESFYKDKRSIFNAGEASDVSMASLFIFLNKTCYNGLYRANRKQIFNSAFGHNPNPVICDERTIVTDSEMLQRVDIFNADFSDLEGEITGPNTFVYMDPPYRPLTPTSSFTYGVFTDEDQQRLKSFCDELTRREVMWMQSNSFNPNDSFLEELYSGYDIEKVFAPRKINTDATKRGKLPELVIRNYTDSAVQKEQLLSEL